MEEAKTTISKNNFIFEYFDKSPGIQGIDNEEEAKGSLSFPKGFVKHENLYKLIPNSTPAKQLNMRKVNKEIDFGDTQCLQDSQEAQMPSDKEKLIIDAYFIHKLKPREIASRFRMNRSSVYKVVEEVKRLLIRASMHRLNPPRIPRLKNIEVWNTIKDYWGQRSHTCYTIQDVRAHLIDKFPSKQVPSCSSIRTVMKSILGLRYKRVSWRPPKIRTNEFRQNKIDYIEFVKTCSKEGYMLIQIDEFTVNRFTWPTMAWINQKDPSYIIQEQPHLRFSNIVAISSQRWEFLTV